MASNSIEVDKEELIVQIDNLRKLIEEVNTSSLETSENRGQGYTSSVMGTINNEFERHIGLLKQLMESTVEVLQNISDGYIDTDEDAARRIDTLTQEVSNE